MDVAHRVGHHVAGDVAIHVGNRRRLMRQRCRKERAHLGRHLAPHRAIPDIPEVSDGVVDNTVRQDLKIGPVRRIESFIRDCRFLQAVHPAAPARRVIVPREIGQCGAATRVGSGAVNCLQASNRQLGVERDSAISSASISASMPSKSGVDM